MLYKEYGKTGIKISVISAGGMRYDKPEDIDASAEVVVEAAKLGINYFDTAPGYCKGFSEQILGAGLKEVRKMGKEFYVSTKSWKSDYDGFMEGLENSLSVIGVDHIDFMHSWGINSWDTLEKRQKDGALDAMVKAKEQGMIKHIVCSSHMSGDDIALLIDKGIFEGITLGFCAINFPFRMPGIKAAYKHDVGVVTMNPLGGGEIIRHADKFSFIKTREDQSMLEAALHFNLSHPEITSALVGFTTVDDVISAVGTLDTFQEVSEEERNKIADNIEESFDELCTTCNYCKGCPMEIPVARFIEAYNHYLLNGNPKAPFDRLKWHWGINDLELLEKCTQCGQCEAQCTQKLPIIERFEKLKEMEKELEK